MPELSGSRPRRTGGEAAGKGAVLSLYKTRLIAGGLDDGRRVTYSRRQSSQLIDAIEAVHGASAPEPQGAVPGGGARGQGRQAPAPLLLLTQPRKSEGELLAAGFRAKKIASGGPDVKTSTPAVNLMRKMGIMTGRLVKSAIRRARHLPTRELRSRTLEAEGDAVARCLPARRTPWDVSTCRRRESAGQTRWSSGCNCWCRAACSRGSR